MARTRDDAVIGEDVALFMHVRDSANMNLVDPYSISDVEIYSVDPSKTIDPGDPLLTLTPEKLSLGTFMVQFTVPLTWCSGRYYDKWAVVVEANQDPVTTVQSFVVRSHSVILDPGTQALNPEQSPRVTLLTKEARAGELKQIRFVLSKPLNVPLPPTQIRISAGPSVLLDWTDVVREGNEGYLLMQMPYPHKQGQVINAQRYIPPFKQHGSCTATFPAILRVQFRLQFGDQLYLSQVSDLRLLRA